MRLFLRSRRRLRRYRDGIETVEQGGDPDDDDMELARVCLTMTETLPRKPSVVS
jgi:hypothetical protein